MKFEPKQILGGIKKHWTTIWLLTALTAVSTLTVHAAFTRLTVAKRVVSTVKGSGDLFSSNYMSTKQMNSDGAVYELNNDGDALVKLDVYNYAAPKKIPYFKELETLDYTITARLVKNSSDHDLEETDISKIADLNYSFGGVRFSANNNYTVTLANQQISSNQPNKNTYDLVFDKSELHTDTANGYMIFVSAVPNPITEYKSITGYIGVREKEIIPAGWYGELIENDSNKEYDGYNYEIKGSGLGYLEIKYNNTEFIPNEAIFKDVSLTLVNQYHTDIPQGEDKSVSDYVYDNGDGTSSFWLKLGYISNSDAVNKTRYIIQFYKIKEYESGNEPALSTVKGMFTYEWKPSN